jgi:hypothetical protein
VAACMLLAEGLVCRNANSPPNSGSTPQLSATGRLQSTAEWEKPEDERPLPRQLAVTNPEHVNSARYSARYNDRRCHSRRVPNLDLMKFNRHSGPAEWAKSTEREIRAWTAASR